MPECRFCDLKYRTKGAGLRVANFVGNATGIRSVGENKTVG